jgi:hypothetical protein
MKFPMLAQDKANHFIYGVLIVAIVRWVFGYFSIPNGDNYGLLAAIVIGALKEIIDILLNKRAARRGEFIRNTPDPMDMIVTWIGAAVAWSL